MAKVEAPNKDYNGVGPGGVVFADGVGNTDDEAALNYYRSAGYTVDGDVTEPEPGEQPDPRDVTNILMGTALRDAAVDPAEGDFLAPLNAGESNPHGPEVVSPQIHASGPAGIRPGEVFVEDVAKQEKRESEFVEARLIEQVTAREAVLGEVPDPDERGELGISDPGSAEMGAQAAEEIATSSDKPAKADSKATWVDYAVSQGADRDEAEASTKQQLVDTYGG